MVDGARGWRSAVGTAALLAITAAATTRCDNGAVGVDACRRIEDRRCEAAIGCTDRIADEDGVTACKLFYRDECMFGIADGVGPDDVMLEACLSAIDKVAACKGQGASIADCANAPALDDRASTPEMTACGLILAPERLAACSFLAPVTAPGGGSPAGGSGGAGGSAGGAAGGSGGAGGAGGG